MKRGFFFILLVLLSYSDILIAEECRPREFQIGDVIFANETVPMDLDEHVALHKIQWIDYDGNIQVDDDYRFYSPDQFCLFVPVNTLDEFEVDQIVMHSDIDGFMRRSTIKVISSNGFYGLTDQSTGMPFIRYKGQTEFTPYIHADSHNHFAVDDCAYIKLAESNETGKNATSYRIQDITDQGYIRINKETLFETYYSHSLLEVDVNQDCN